MGLQHIRVVWISLPVWKTPAYFATLSLRKKMFYNICTRTLNRPKIPARNQLTWRSFRHSLPGSASSSCRTSTARWRWPSRSTTSQQSVSIYSSSTLASSGRLAPVVGPGVNVIKIFSASPAFLSDSWEPAAFPDPTKVFVQGILTKYSWPPHKGNLFSDKCKYYQSKRSWSKLIN